MNYFLNGIPNDIEDQLQREYIEIKRHFQLNEVRPSELDGGRFAEVMLRIYQHLLQLPVTPFGTEIKPPEKTRIINQCVNDPGIDKHIRQKVTSLSRLLLDFRNDRDVAHLGGLNANRIDAQLILSSSNWIYAELIRVFGSCSLEQAQELIDSIAIPNYPVIFEIEGEEFIATGNLTTRQQILVLLLIKERNIDFLFNKTREKNKSRFIKLLLGLENQKKIVNKGGCYYLMPLGIEEINSNNLLNPGHNQ
jgi:hypothetical protein